jgi:hypothetical protein
MKSNRTAAVLPELERSLAAGAAAQTRGSRFGAMRQAASVRAVRVAAIGATCLAFGGTAMAATGVWNPSIGDQANTPSPAISATPVPAAMAEALGAFRRAPDAQDHGPAVEATLSTLGGRFADGIRPDSVRYLGDDASGEAMILVSAEHSLFTSGDAVNYFGSGEPACVVVPSSGEGGEAAPMCFGLDKILAGDAEVQIEGTDHGETLSGEAWGLVPDGVASVTARFGDGAVHQVPVTDNHFVYRWGNTQANQVDREQFLVFSTRHSKDTVWRDAAGNVVPQQPAG